MLVLLDFGINDSNFIGLESSSPLPLDELGGVTIPPEISNLNASSTEIESGMTPSSGTMAYQPLVGLGVVGIKICRNSWLSLISSLFYSCTLIFEFVCP